MAGEAHQQTQNVSEKPKMLQVFTQIHADSRGVVSHVSFLRECMLPEPTLGRMYAPWAYIHM